MNPEKEFFTIKQLAEIWGASEKFVWLLIESGQLAHVRIGKRLVRVTRQQLEDYLSSNSKGE